MMLAALGLILSTATFFFCLQAACHRILRRRFERDYFRSVADAHGLEFPSLQKSLEELDAPLEYSRLCMMLERDFLTLTYLLKCLANVDQRSSSEERLLTLYFRCQFHSLAARRLFRLGEERTMLELTSVLEYLANSVGQREEVRSRLTHVFDRM